MNKEKAIEIIKSLPAYRAELIYERESDLAKALELAIEAIEKQIPKKPIVQKRGIFDCIDQLQIYNATICPTCGKELYIQFREYPCKCGQMIDWSEY